MMRNTLIAGPKHASWILAILILLATARAGVSEEENRVAPGNVKPASPITLLAIDDFSLPLKKGLCYYLSKPTVRKEGVLTPSRGNPNAPDNVAAHFYGTALHDGGKFRLWYYSVSWKDGKPGQFREGPICYAESEDGLHWVKPNLGQVEFNGSRNNNAIAVPGFMTEGAFLVKDDEDPDPNRRYKLVYENMPSHRKYYSVRTATSPDGLRWTAGAEIPIEEGLEPCSFYKYGGLYFINAHFAPNGVSEGGYKAGRQGFVWVSTDFETWLPECGESFTLPEPADPDGRGLDKPYTQVHLGVAPQNLGNVLVGFYCIWVARPKAGDWFGSGTTYGDFGLVVSNDGQHFREPVKGYVYLNRNESHAPLPAEIPHENVLCQGNGILNVGDKTLIYHGRWANTARDEDYYAEIARAELPRDRWGALGLYRDFAEGTVWSAPITLPQQPCAISVNADGTRGIRVEIADERFVPLANFADDHAGEVVSNDGLDCPVKFKASLATLAGKTVRLRLHLKKGDYQEPRLYAVYLKPEQSR